MILPVLDAGDYAGGGDHGDRDIGGIFLVAVVLMLATMVVMVLADGSDNCIIGKLIRFRSSPSP